MKKRYIKYIAVTVVCVLIIVIKIHNHTKTPSNDTASDMMPDQSANTEVEYTANSFAGCEYLGYNYISNPEKLNDIDILAIGLTNLGDKINEYVTSLGYNNCQLNISNIVYDNPYITIYLSIVDKDVSFTAVYDNLTNEYTFQKTS